MNRRRFLGTVGTAGTTSSLSGCLGYEITRSDRPDPLVDAADEPATTDASRSTTASSTDATDAVTLERKLRLVLGHEIGLQQALDGQTVLGIANDARSDREWGTARDHFWKAYGFYQAAEGAFERTHEEATTLELYAAEGLLGEGRDHARLMGDAAAKYAETYDLLEEGRTSEASDRLDEANDDESEAGRYQLVSTATLRRRLDLPTR